MWTKKLAIILVMRKTALTIAAVLFVLLIGPVLLFFNLSRTIGNPAFPQEVIDETQFPQRLLQSPPSEIIGLIWNNQDKNKPSESEVSAFMRATSPQTLKNTLTESLGTASQLFFKDPSEGIDVSLTDLKREATTNKESSTSLADVVHSLPDSYTVKLPDTITAQKGFLGGLPFYPIIGLAVLALLMMVAILLEGGGRSRLRLGSFMLLFGGLAAFIPYTVLRLITFKIPFLQNATQLIRDFIGQVVIIARRDIGEWYYYEAILLVFLALVLLLISFFVRHKAASSLAPPGKPVGPPAPKPTALSPSSPSLGGEGNSPSR